MIENESGSYERIDLTRDETIALLESRGIPWKTDGDGNPVAVDFGNREERRKARYGTSWKENH